MRRVNSDGTFDALLDFTPASPRLCLPRLPSTAAFASETEFYRTIEGRWIGPGEIVAGKYKGTKFTCDFNGITPANAKGMSIDGNCRVGVFNQPMNASVTRVRAAASTGKFLDGEAGEGMDIVGGRFSGFQARCRRQAQGPQRRDGRPPQRRRPAEHHRVRQGRQAAYPGNRHVARPRRQRHGHRFRRQQACARKSACGNAFIVSARPALRRAFLLVHQDRPISPWW